MAVLAQLRAATAADHEAVDAAFGRFDLADRDSYAAFLAAHARALPAVEAVLAGTPGLPPLRRRGDLLRQDLSGLGHDMPDPLPFAAPLDQAEAFGMAYVIEGSRLGGGLLARQVGPDVPSAYLSAVHLPGEWRAFGQAMDAAGAARGQDWIDRCIAAARAVFALYGRAAGA